MTAARSIRNRLYVFSNREIPQKLLDCILKHMTGYDVHYRDSHGRLGLGGITKPIANRYGFDHKDMTDYERSLECVTVYLRDTIRDIRKSYPSMSLKDWYLFALACYYSSFDKVMASLNNLMIKDWQSYSRKYRYGVEFAERTWNEFKRNKGTIK